MTFNYGLIGNCRTAALISDEGSIDWVCFPRFDSPSVFAKILDEKKGGSCEIHPVGKYTIDQHYLPKTNILETRFHNLKAEFVVLDFFPRYRYGEKIEKLSMIIRQIKVVRGNPKIRLLFNPKFNYALGKTTVKLIETYAMAKSKDERLYLYSDLDLSKILKKKPLSLTGDHYLVLSYKHHFNTSHKMVNLLFAKTKQYWQEFVKFSTLPPMYKDAVTRSILVLKLLTHEGGAVVAAPTTSLPEILGEERNWDYRYCWLRDASFTIDALTKICHFDEAENFINWLTHICLNSRNRLQIVYRVDGDKNLREYTLPHLSGYKNSKPVRIGNHAYVQKQLDIYGEIIEAFYLFFHHYNYAEIEPRHWKVIEKVVNTVIKVWKEEDSGLWEFRGKKKHFTFSKFMCWVAMDRAVKMARNRKHPNLVKVWGAVRNEIRVDIMKNAWNPKVKAFTQSYGSDVLDASNLLMVYFNFLPATHPKMKSTISASMRSLVRQCFVYRYVAKDDFGKPKNAFSVCTFWLIDALYMAGDKANAKNMFRNMLSKGNYLGLFSEDINPTTYELTGNFPQAYTHLAIINTATLLSSGYLRRPACNIHFEMLQD